MTTYLRTALIMATVTLFAGGAARGAAIAHWSFDELAGDTTITDDVGGNTATLASGTPTLGVTGQFGTAVDMPGTAWYNVARFTGFHTTSNTFASWIKLDTTSHNQEILGQWTSNHEFRWELAGGTNLRNASGGDVVQGGTNVADTTSWHHVAWVWDRPVGKMYFYVDGVLSLTLNGTANVNVRNTESHLYNIGRKGDSGVNFEGMLDELWLFNEALAEEQVNNLMDFNDIVAPVPVPAPAALPAGLALTGLATLRRRSPNRASR